MVRFHKLEAFMEAQKSGMFCPKDYRVIIERGRGASKKIRKKMETEYWFNRAAMTTIDEFPSGEYPLSRYNTAMAKKTAPKDGVLVTTAKRIEKTADQIATLAHDVAANPTVKKLGKMATKAGKSVVAAAKSATAKKAPVKKSVKKTVKKVALKVAPKKTKKKLK